LTPNPLREKGASVARQSALKRQLLLNPDPRKVLLFSLLIKVELLQQQLAVPAPESAEWLILILPALWRIGHSTNYHDWCQKTQDWSHSPAYEHDFYQGNASIWLIFMKVKQA
jgi:hypothetical protein